MTVTLLYVDGCPHVSTFEDRLRSALSETGREDAVTRLEVLSVEHAELVGFVGSPSVHFDGSDAFADETAPPSLGCRIYRTPAGFAGAPTVDQLVEVLER